jgi:thymidylate synthase (FAD)
MAVTPEVISETTIPVLDHGFVRLDDAMATDLSVVNAARVSFARRKDEMDASDEGLIRFLMRDRHGTPFEHNAFRFHVRAPIFVAREWFRHRVGCLTGDTVVSFVDTNGHATATLQKTIDELWRMWTRGERNGHAHSPEMAESVDRLAASGLGIRATSRSLGIGRRSVRSRLSGRNDFRDAQWRLRKMKLRVLDESTGEFVTGRIADIFDKGVQPVYRLTLADGKELTLTTEHRVLTDGGWKIMADAVGLRGQGHEAEMTRRCALMINGIPLHQDREWLRSRRAAGCSVSQIATEAGCSYHTIRKRLAHHELKFSREEQYRGRRPWNAGKRGYSIRLVHAPEHLAAIRRARSGSRSNFWRGGVSTERESIARWTTEHASAVHEQYEYTCKRCSVRGGRLHAHHIVPVWVDESLARETGNLITVCEKCHRMIHRTRESELDFARDFAGWVGFAADFAPRRTRGWKLTAHSVDVIAVDYIGLRQTYDLSVEGPWHNFVANGVVVHNSFNEFSMRYAKATDDFYVPEPEDVRTQVGKPGAYSFDPVDPELAERTRDELREVYETAYATYARLVEAGVARELARSVMPVGAYTEFFWTVNARALMNFVSLRAAETAQREIQRYAEAVERFFAERMPVTHDAFVAAGRVAP